ncbi:MAG: nucleoside deaminase [Chitinophagales bacterium]
MNRKDDENFMRLALKDAQYAFDADEVPIGALITANGKIIAKGWNQVEKLCDVTAHAEMIALTAASNYMGAKFLEDCTLYVTVEPCPMCAAALRWARVGRVVYGAADPKAGFSRFGKEMFHPKTEIVGGILQEECGALMSNFFAKKRNEK